MNIADESFSEEQLRWLWGKTDEKNPSAYHPLLFHLIDAGHAAGALWDDVLTDALRAHVASVLQMDEAAARLILVLVAALHDIGKCTPVFQHQSFRGDGPRYLQERLEKIGLARASVETVHHGYASTRVLAPGDNAPGVLFGNEIDDLATAKIWARLTGGHHGTIPIKELLDAVSNDALGDARWDAARRALIEKVVEVFGEGCVLPLPATAMEAPEVVPLIAGLISVADWIASWQDHFPCGACESGSPPLSKYVALSANRTEEAMKDIGWNPRPKLDKRGTGFQETFGYAPNPLQRKIVELSETWHEPFLLIVETPMGSGKTEAALWAADAQMMRGGARGFYIAMPTQATSDAMYRRLLSSYFKTRHHLQNIELQLAHGNAALVKANEPAVTSVHGEHAAKGNADESAQVRSWFSARKRPLLAPFGIGTIDQALLGVLQTKHWFVRQFGLHEKIVVFDEVHAVDVHQSVLLELLLQWLRVLGCSVILLSATLPANKRRALLKAWNKNMALGEEARYPRLTLARGKETQLLSVPIEADAPKTYRLTHHPTDEHLIAATLRKKLRQGGCAIVFCNTVARAQDVFQTLREELADWISEDLIKQEDFHLLHARMPMKWRKQREEEILARFGKDRSNRPKRAIIVSTQVLEASVDFSADFMMSEMAPVDLLLQRLGREHRHATDVNNQKIEPPPHLKEPEFAVLCDAPWNGAPPACFGDYDGTVYQRSLLLRSWLALRDLPDDAASGRSDARLVEIPGNLESLIEAVYGNATFACDNSWQRELETAHLIAEDEREKGERIAKTMCISAPKSPSQLVEKLSMALYDGDDPETHASLRALTRGGRPSITVTCLCQVNDRFYLPNDRGEADLSNPIDPKKNPHFRQSQALLEYSLSISNRRLYKHFVECKPSAAWQKNPHLRHTRLLVLQDGVCQAAGYALRLDAALGLVADKN